MISGMLFVAGAAGGAFVGGGTAWMPDVEAAGGYSRRLKFVTPKTVNWFVLSSTISGLS
jgi:hypothetical protein